MELYVRVRRAALIEGKSQRMVAREFGLARKTVRKMLACRHHRINRDPQIPAHARAYRLGILEDHLQDETVSRLEEAATDSFDLSLFVDESILRLIPPARLLSLGIRLRVDTLINAPDRIVDIAEEADLGDDPESHFEHYSRGLDILEELPDIDDTTLDVIKEVRQAVASAIEGVSERKDAEENRIILRNGVICPPFRERAQSKIVMANSLQVV